jgi:glutamate-5-semialdehyde dehydrogenase
VRERRAAVLAANALDVEQEPGASTRDARPAPAGRCPRRGPRHAARGNGGIEPLEREVDAWTLPNGLRVSERRIPIGTVGANFEARPNVALDVAGQLLKSLNTAVLRTGSAALGTVTTLVDDVLRPALEASGLPPGAVGLVRSPDRAGARLLVSMPKLASTRAGERDDGGSARLAAENGVRTLAHAEGGGVLYVHASASRERRSRSPRRASIAWGSATASTSRSSIALRRTSCPRCSSSSRGRGSRCAAPSRSAAARPPARARVGERPERVATITIVLVDDLDEAVRIANGDLGPRGGDRRRDADAAQRFLDGYQAPPRSGTPPRASRTASS